MLSIGLVGYGFGGRNFHAPLIAGTAECRLAGVVTRSPQRRKQLAEDHPDTPAFDSMEDLIRAGIDAVVISVPPCPRFELVLQALDSDVPTVSDKPFALNRKDARTMIDASRRLNVPLTVYMNRRWDSDYLTVKKLFRSGELGEIRRFYSGFELHVPENNGNPTGGGLLRDLGSHMVDQVFCLLGPVESVYADVDEMPDDAELNDGFYLILKHANGLRSHVNGFLLQHRAGPRFKVDGTGGSFSIEGLDIQTDQVFNQNLRFGDEVQWGVEPEHRWGIIQNKDRVERYPSENGSWQEFYKRLAGALLHDERLPVDLDDALAVTTVLDAALISSRENRVVDIKELES